MSTDVPEDVRVLAHAVAERWFMGKDHEAKGKTPRDRLENMIASAVVDLLETRRLARIRFAEDEAAREERYERWARNGSLPPDANGGLHFADKLRRGDE